MKHCITNVKQTDLKTYAKDKIYFTWLPRKTDNDGWKWLTWIRDVLVSNDGISYYVIIRELYKK